MATSTLAPVTSFLPLPVDCTCMMARWITRWNPSVGCVSTSSVPATWGVLSLMKFASDERRSSILAEHARSTCAGVIEQCKQQMLHGDELVALLTGLNKGHVQADFQFLGNHVNSFVLAWKG